MEQFINSSIEEYLRALSARAGITNLTDCELVRVGLALSDVFGSTMPERTFTAETARHVSTDVEFRRGRIEAAMHAGPKVSKPLIRLAVALRASEVIDLRADELCDLYAIAVRELAPQSAA